MVTIGLPFFNSESTLADAIRSVFAQTVQDWELLLVDDGSSDRSLEIARSVEDRRVRVLIDGHNRGLGTRLNQIAQTARGGYLARLDADDLLHPERIARQVAVLDSQPQVDLVGTAMFSLDRGDRPRGLHEIRPVAGKPADVLQTSLLNHATITGRAAWFRANPYDEAFRRSEDRELWVRTHRTLSFVQLPEPLYYCREEQSINLKKYLGSCAWDRRIFRLYGPELIGVPATARLCLRSLLKEQVHRLFTLLSANEYLVHQRVPRLSSVRAAAAGELLERIKHTSVPGLSARWDKVTVCAG